MSLLVLADEKKTTILIDCCICETAEEDGHDGRAELLARLPRDAAGRPYVDVMILSHPDEDHCRGLLAEFHLGPMSTYDVNSKKIIIREMWSSPLIFRRRSEDHPLCEDAAAWNTEAKRRVNWFRNNKPNQPSEGDRILILGGDDPNHTDGVEELIVPTGSAFNKIAGKPNAYALMHLLGPLPAEELDEDSLDKNDSSVIIRFTLSAAKDDNLKTLFLCGGDAAVAIWKTLWNKYKNTKSILLYDLLLAPHHCSWTVVSSEPYDKGKGRPDQEALDALGVIRDGGIIVSSSNEIKDDDNNPPCIGAKIEYVKITTRVSGVFLCTGEAAEMIEFLITSAGLQRVERVRSAYKKASATGVVSTPAQHG